MTSWISLYPQWFIAEQKALARSYPKFRIDEGQLLKGVLCYYGELLVRPSSGSKRYPVRLTFPNATPFCFPFVTPVESLPEFDEDGVVVEHPRPVFFDKRHQMPGGSLCLFQQETRGTEGGECVSAIEVLKRAEFWFMGHLTGRWPPDSQESELESHFRYAGDVLLSSRFYAAEITGNGRFYMVRDMRRLFDALDRSDPPFIVTVLTQITEGVEAPYDAREELIHIFPWLGNDAWSPEQLAEFEDKQQNDLTWDLCADHGFWWSLPEEPTPIRDGVGLLRLLESVAPDSDAWKMISSVMRGDLARRSKHFFGFRYPGRHGRDEWLILRMRTQDKQRTASGGLILSNISDSDKRADFEKGAIDCFLVHGARPDEIQLRNSTVVRKSIREKTVALIGLGALGSKVAELLAQAGVGAFRLCDGDILTTGNVARHVGGLSDFGARKTRVVASRIHDINPHLHDTIVFDSLATSSIAGLRDFIASADLIISTIADENAESAINQVAVIDSVPVIYGRAMRSGSMGRVFLVRPGIDACKRCIGIHAESATPPHDWIPVSERDGDVLLHECGRPVIPASAIDLSFVASLIARRALDFLEGRLESANHWLWSQEEAVGIDSRLDRPLSTVEGTLERLSDCPCCQEPEIVEVVLTDEVRKLIHSEVESSPKLETGGVLIGYVENRKAIVLRATGPGPNAVRTARRFERDVDFIQSEIERAASELGVRGLYVGEWHSHLERSPEPSGRDVLSLSGIAESSNYPTRCPVMLIAGLDPETGDVAVLKTWAFPVSRRMHEIELIVPKERTPSNQAEDNLVVRPTPIKASSSP